MTLGEVIAFCERIATPGDTLLRQANGKPIEMSSLSARFHELIVAVCGKDAYQEYEWPSLHEVRSVRLAGLAGVSTISAVLMV